MRMDSYEQEIEKLNDERRAAAERINELMKYRDMKQKLELCNKEGHLWTLTRVESDFDKVTFVSMLCTRTGATVDITPLSTKIYYTDMDGKPIPQEILDAAQNK